MAGNYTKISDLVTGSEGSAFITVDGQNRYFFELSKIEANIEFTVIAKKLLIDVFYYNEKNDGSVLFSTPQHIV